MRTWIATSRIFAALAGPTRSAASADFGHDAQAQIQQVIERFQTAVIKKDRAALGDLFLSMNNSRIAPVYSVNLDAAQVK